MQACPRTIHLELHSRMPQYRFICMCAFTLRAFYGLRFELPEPAVEDQGHTTPPVCPCCKAKAITLCTMCYSISLSEPSTGQQLTNPATAAFAGSAPYLLHHALQWLPYNYVTPNPALPTPQVARSPRHACKRGCWRTATPGTGVTLGGLGPHSPLPSRPAQLMPSLPSNTTMPLAAQRSPMTGGRRQVWRLGMLFILPHHPPVAPSHPGASCSSSSSP